MTTVAGIDPSLTATAACIIRDGDDVRIEVSRTKPTGSTSSLGKLERMHKQAGFAALVASDADVVLMEGPSFASQGTATRDLAGLWWLMFAQVVATCPAVGVVSPSVLKKWATGKGNADKFMVGQHIAKRWPRQALSSNDEADALGLAGIGLHHVGALAWEPTVFQREALAKVEWTRAAGLVRSGS